MPLLGVQNHDSMKPHGSLPDGRCWIFPTLACGQHRDIFEWGLDAMIGFPMSPGHAILTPRVGAAPGPDEFVLIGDDRLPNEGTVDFWIETFRTCQARLGPALGLPEYERRRREYDAADSETLRRLAADPEAAFRDDAAAALEGDSDPALVEAVETALREERYGHALRRLREARGPRAREQRRFLERAAWHFLSRARMDARNGDGASAKAGHRRVVEEFPDTEAARSAQKEGP